MLIKFAARHRIVMKSCVYKRMYFGIMKKKIIQIENVTIMRYGTEIGSSSTNIEKIF